jgi:hypothetical protein
MKIYGMFWREFDTPSAIKQYGYAKREENFSLTKICVIEQDVKFCICIHNKDLRFKNH